LVQDYKELLVWQKAMDLAAVVYQATADFPSTEKFGLRSQMQRAAVSVPSNIAEGQGRLTTGEFKHFLGNARGSLLELETQALLAERLGLLSADTCQDVQQRKNDVAKLLNGLIRSLERRKAQS